MCQAVEFLDRKVDPSSPWGGVDLFPAGLRETSISLVQNELDKFGLMILDVPGKGKGLHTAKSLREGEVVCPATTLWFLQYDKLMDCLRTGDNCYFGDGVHWLKS